jgi:prephenate dehydratase
MIHMTPHRPIVAFQGDSGSFSERAASELVGGPFTPMPCATFGDAVRAVTEHGVDYAVLPVHNLIAGPVDAALHAIASTTQLEQVAEHLLPVRLALLGLPDSSASQIREVLSHPVALLQCGRWLAAHPRVRAVEAYDTAGAARMVALRRDRHAAAIAAVWAAAHYGLVVLEEGLEDRGDNVTRFVLLRRKPFAELGASAS